MIKRFAHETRKLYKFIAAALTAALLFGMAAVMYGCSGKSNDYDADLMSPSGGGNFSNSEAYDDNMMADADMAEDETGGSPVDSALPEGIAERKRIEYVTIDMQTLEFDDTVAELKSRTTSSGGYIESSKETGKSIYEMGTRRATFVLRIPASETGRFSESIAELGTIISQNVDSKDVTTEYFDTEARLASLEMQRDKYMELLDEAKDMYAIVELTNALTNVIYEIESYTTTLRRYDSLIEYSTVTVYVSEVAEAAKAPEEVTFLDRMSDAFSDSVDAFVAMSQNVAVALVASLPFISIPAAVAVIVVVIVAVRRKKRRKIAKSAMMSMMSGNNSNDNNTTSGGGAGV